MSSKENYQIAFQCVVTDIEKTRGLIMSLKEDAIRDQMHYMKKKFEDRGDITELYYFLMGLRVGCIYQTIQKEIDEIMEEIEERW